MMWPLGILRKLSRIPSDVHLAMCSNLFEYVFSPTTDRSSTPMSSALVGYRFLTVAYISVLKLLRYAFIIIISYTHTHAHWWLTDKVDALFTRSIIYKNYGATCTYANEIIVIIVLIFYVQKVPEFIICV